jgi:hypothetical protein
MRQSIVVASLMGLLIWCGGCAHHTSTFNAEVFGDNSPQAIIASLQKQPSKVLLAWFTDAGLNEVVISEREDKQVVLAWFSRNLKTLNSIPPPKEAPGATRPWWEMSVFDGDDPWRTSAKRICIYHKASLSDPAFHEIQQFFQTNGKRRGNAEPDAAPNGGPAASAGNSGVTQGPPSVS